MIKRVKCALVSFLLFSLPAMIAWAATGEEKAPNFAARQVKTEGLSAFNAFFAVWYNSNKIIFAAIVTVLMGLAGAAIAFITEILLKRVGLDVSKIEHNE